MNGDRSYGLWFPLALGLFFQAVLIAHGTSPVLDGELLGPDSYMRLNRVTLLHDTGAWFDSTIPRSNAPYGDVLHWTRPFDALLLAGAWLAAPFGDFDTALYWSGAVVGPVLQLLVLIALWWAAAPLLDRGRGVLLALLSLVQPAIIHFYFAGRADHHGLILLLFVVSTGLVIRLLVERFRAGLCHWAGVVAALSLWVSVESLVALLVNLVTLALFWIFSDRDLARKNFHFSAALLVGLTVALLLERPFGGILDVEYDRLSIVHWVVGGLALAFWGTIGPAGRTIRPLGRPFGRLIAAALGAVIAVGLVGAAFPAFFKGPLAGMDPRAVDIWLERIGEFQPLIDPDNPALGPFVYWLGLALPALPFLAWTAWKPLRPADRAAWIYLCIGLALFLPLAFLQVRWTGYAAVILLFPYAGLLAGVFDRIGGLGARLQPLARTAALVVFCGLFTVLGLTMMRIEEGTLGSSPPPSSCRVSRLSAFLDDPGGWGDRQRTILAPVDFGPELLYRTRHRVVATPYHRNLRGMGLLDASLIMSSTDMRAPRALIEQRRIDLIVLCPSGGFHKPSEEPPNLYRRLLDHQPPPWLREVRLPAELAGGFRLFEVPR